MKEILLEQKSWEWKKWRNGGLGGSDIAAIMGLSPYGVTRDDIFLEKTLGVGREETFAMRYGNRLEPEARLLYDRYKSGSETHLFGFEPTCGEHDEEPWIRMSFDGMNHMLEIFSEFKCPDQKTHGNIIEGWIPQHFEVQVIWGKFLVPSYQADFVSYNQSERWKETFPLMVMEDVQVDPELAVQVLDCAREFWLKVEDFFDSRKAHRSY